MHCLRLHSLVRVEDGRKTFFFNIMLPFPEWKGGTEQPSDSKVVGGARTATPGRAQEGVRLLPVWKFRDEGAGYAVPGEANSSLGGYQKGRNGPERWQKKTRCFGKGHL